MNGNGRKSVLTNRSKQSNKARTLRIETLEDRSLLSAAPCENLADCANLAPLDANAVEFCSVPDLSAAVVDVCEPLVTTAAERDANDLAVVMSCGIDPDNADQVKWNTDGRLTYFFIDGRDLYHGDEIVHQQGWDIRSIDLSSCSALRDVTLQNCRNLRSINLSGLQKLGNVSINNNPSLEDLNLDNTSVYRVFLYDNDAMLDLEITGMTATSFSCTSNGSLTSVSAINCTSGSFSVGNNLSLSDLDFTNSSVKLELYKENLSSVDLSSFSELKEINVHDMPSMSSLNLSGLQKLSYVYIDKNPSLTNLNLDDVKTGKASVYDNDAMIALNITGMKLTNGDFSCYDNDSLTSISAINCSATGSFSIGNNPALVNLDFTDSNIGLTLYNENLSSVDLTPYTELTGVNVHDMPTMESLNLSGLQKLSDVKIYENPSLTNLNLDDIKAGTVSVYDNDAMIALNITGMRVNTSSGFKCYDNDSLSSFSATNYCQAPAFKVYNNPVLTNVDLSNNPTQRNYEVYNNAVGTMSVEGCASLDYLYCAEESLRTLYVTDECAFDMRVGKSTAWDSLIPTDSSDQAITTTSTNNYVSFRVEADNAYTTAFYPVTMAFYSGGDLVRTSSIVMTTKVADSPSVVVTTVDDGYDANDGQISLREAIVFAGTNDLGTVITFDSSLNGQTITLAGTQLEIDKKLTINGWDAQNDAPGITISGDNASRVFYVTGNYNVELIGMRIVAGSAARDYGGGVYNEGRLTIRNTDFDSNSARLGGAIYNKGTLTVSGTQDRPSLFTNNDATGTTVAGVYKYGSGGGLYNSSGTATLTNVSFSDNAAYKYGGAISNFATLNAENIACDSNEAGAGGALHNSGVAVVTGFSAQDNQASVRGQALAGSDFGGNGGAIFQSNNASSSGTSTLTLNGSTFEGNSAQNAGGAADLLSGTVTFKGSNSFYTNTADVVGGALVVAGEVAFNNASFTFAKENESNTNDAPFGATIASTSDADAIIEGFFGTSDLNALTNDAPYTLFDTFVRSETITDSSGSLSLDFDFFANTTAESVTYVTVLRVDNGTPIIVVKGTPSEGEVNEVTLSDIGVVESEWNSGDSFDVYYYVNGNADYKFKLTLTKATNGSMMIQRIDMDGHAASGVVGFNFRTFGYEPVSSWTINWDEKDGNGDPLSDSIVTYEGLGYLWNAFHMYEDEGVNHRLTLSVRYADNRTDSFVLDCVSPRKTTNSGAVLDEFFADEDWIDDLFEA